ncbi:uncharacterized protein LOC127289414 [Leptopilina boulardi]|uniref:uncharacterized protein LOC127289414 n=1 Tax=Leptopilina boulardi TaxID=63433 RepID=UPI0021F6658D|nr:uncharacterized protein LOC127289414 [Leptopilina boulardi]
MDTHYLQECFVCKDTNKVKRCSGCNMITYCKKEHQIQHRPKHKKFCKVISEMLKSQNKSHIYENIDSSIWFEEKNRIIGEVESKFIKESSPTQEEYFLLDSPRVCYICCEANQDKLKTCPKCLITSFCNIHPSSHIHERYCRKNSVVINKEAKFIMNPNLPSLVSLVVAGIKIVKSDDYLLTSMDEFFELYTQQQNISEMQKILLSEVFSISLTIFSALKTVFNNIPSKLIIHLKSINCGWTIMVLNLWESLLHLLPEIKYLKIVYVESYKLSNNYTSVLNLCMDCKLKRKIIIVEMNPVSYNEPSLIAILNSTASCEIDFFRKIGYFKEEKTKLQKLTCPLVLTSSILTCHNFSKVDLLNLFSNCRTIYSGYNDFSSHFETMEVKFLRHSQFMTIVQPDENVEQKFTIVNNETSYYPQICNFCHKTEGKIICKRCKIVSYCDKKHLNQDQIHHKDLCEVIFRLQQEMKEKYLFYEEKTLNQDEWLSMRIEKLKNVQMRIGRKLTKNEEEMFLFPKSCGVCHDSDSNLLKSCECGVFLCKTHKNDPTHKKICKELSIDFKMSSNAPIINVNFSLLEQTADEISKMKNSDSTKAFIEIVFSLLNELSDKLFNGKLPVSMEMLTPPLINKISVKEDNFSKILFVNNFLSAPLTLFYTMEKINKKINSSMIIHIIGANKENFEEKFLWAFLFYHVNQLENLKIIFIGSEFRDFPIIDVFNYSDMKINLKIEVYALNYDEYFSSKKFVKPDVIFGCGLNIHEKKLSTPERIWKNTILTLEKMEVPFILTAGTKERAENDHKTICDLLAKSVNFEFFEENPFASLCLKRDFETTGIMYSNKYIIAYNWKLQNSSNSTET